MIVINFVNQIFVKLPVLVTWIQGSNHLNEHGVYYWSMVYIPDSYGIQLHFMLKTVEHSSTFILMNIVSGIRRYSFKYTLIVSGQC